MVFENIELLKQQYTDKYVVVDESRPELKRFKDQTGVVRTVNMSGRALVEFDAHKNIGWYDIELDYLKVIDKPLPKPEPEAKASPKAAPKPAAGKKAAGGMSVEEMLAAARGEKGGAKKSPAKEPVAEKAAATGKVDPKKMSVEEMLAAARGQKAGGAAPAAEPDAAAAPAAETEPAPAAADPEPAPTTTTSKSDLPTDVDGIVAYCRETDGS